jgi:Fe-S cluster assembly protein SufD
MKKIRIVKINFKKAIVVGKGEEVYLDTVSIYKNPKQKGEAVVKAVVINGGKLTMRGLIRVEKGAVKSEAFLRQNILLVGEGSRATATPWMEIKNDDVKASHAATVGRIDDEQMFYLMSRGITKNKAELTLAKSFIGEVSDKAAEKKIQDLLNYE